MFYNGTSNIATVFVEVRLVDDVRRVEDSVDVVCSELCPSDCASWRVGDSVDVG